MARGEAQAGRAGGVAAMVDNQIEFLELVCKKSEKTSTRYSLYPESCEICGEHETAVGNNGKPKRLARDHCHKTGQVRGRLCQRCNVGLGLFGDDVDVLKKAAEYLQQDYSGKMKEEIKKVVKLIKLPYRGRGIIDE